MGIHLGLVRFCMKCIGWGDLRRVGKPWAKGAVHDWIRLGSTRYKIILDGGGQQHEQKKIDLNNFDLLELRELIYNETFIILDG